MPRCYGCHFCTYSYIGFTMFHSRKARTAACGANSRCTAVVYYSNQVYRVQKQEWVIGTFFPTCQVRVSRFYHRLSRLFSSPLFLLVLHCELQRSGGHCLTSTASARSQWALPDLSQTPGRTAEGMSDRMPEHICHIYFQIVCQKLCQNSVSGWASLEESNCWALSPLEPHSSHDPLIQTVCWIRLSKSKQLLPESFDQF